MCIVSLARIAPGVQERSINESLKVYKPEVDVWSNFRRLLE